MFTYEDAVELLKELKLPVNEENIKWAYTTLLKELKLEVKIRKFEHKTGESIFGDCCCGGECDCDESCSCHHHEK